MEAISVILTNEEGNAEQAFIEEEIPTTPAKHAMLCRLCDGSIFKDERIFPYTYEDVKDQDNHQKKPRKYV